MTAKEIAEVILKDFKETDWFGYLDTVGPGNVFEDDEAFVASVANDIDNGSIDKIIAFAEELVEEWKDWEDWEDASRYRHQIKILNQYREEHGI